MIAFAPQSDRIADTVRFYISTLPNQGTCRRLSGLKTCDGRMAWLRRGVYIFFECGEERSRSGPGDRVVRVGTHALKPGSGTSLWNRLSQHRGATRSGRGNHRSSIFRRIIGAALARRGNAPLPASWGIGKGTGGAARRLHIDRATVKCEEADLEQCVSEYIGSMPFLWLEIDDPPGPTSRRGFVERNAIALLSHALEPAVDVPSRGWLGAFSDRARIRESGLWNNHHVSIRHDPSFLDVMEAAIDKWRG